MLVALNMLDLVLHMLHRELACVAQARAACFGACQTISNSPDDHTHAGVTGCVRKVCCSHQSRVAGHVGTVHFYNATLAYVLSKVQW
jgi:hypothetical protein